MSHESQVSTDELSALRHSLAHLLAAAVAKHFPKALPTIGPATDTGFYYDFDFGDKAPSETDLETLTKEMRSILATWQKEGVTFTKKEVSVTEAREYFKDNHYKLELIDDIEAAGETITFYTSGEFTDLCRGGHVEDIRDIKPDAFTLTSIAGAYWRGDEKNTMLTRIYGLAFNTKAELTAYQKQVEEARARDHRKLGSELDLFVFSETVGKGLPLFTPRGSIVRRELERFIVDEETKRGYLHVYTPDIAKLDLYRKSGHYPHYQDSMYAPIEIDDEQFMLRPMTCPHHFELFLTKPRSYRELPMRIAELAKLYRYEQSGELSGLIRVRGFCLADAHIICKDEEQSVEEIGKALDLIEYVAGVFGLEQGRDYRYRLSLGDRNDTQDKYYKNDGAWDKGESLLRDLLMKRGNTFFEEAGEAAFYGPKIDVQMQNVNGKEDTAFTVQYDFCMPERFDLKYIDSDGKEKRAFVVHRSSIGAIERVMAFLIEHFAGAFPLWLSPTQVTLLPVAEKHQVVAEELAETMREKGLRVEILNAETSLGKRLRNVKAAKVPYYAVLGDKEIESNELVLEDRAGLKSKPLTSSEVAEKLKQAYETRSLDPICN